MTYQAQKEFCEVHFVTCLRTFVQRVYMHV